MGIEICQYRNVAGGWATVREWTPLPRSSKRTSSAGGAATAGRAL
jgi:hypothetical protein